MKSVKLHSAADLYLLGYTVPAVHTCMDAASKTLGPQHRQVGHIYPVIEAMGLIFGAKGKICALLHLLLDLDILDSKFIESQLPKRRYRHAKGATPR
jgi:hypothetical protein